jgi:hypothetical protein
MDIFAKVFDGVSESLTDWVGDIDLSDVASFIDKGAAFVEEDQARVAKAKTTAANIGSSSSIRDAYKPSTSKPAVAMSPEQLEARWKSMIAAYISQAEGTAVRPAAGDVPSFNSVQRQITG